MKLRCKICEIIYLNIANISSSRDKLILKLQVLFYMKWVYLRTGLPRSVLFNIFMNDLDKGMECTLLVFANDIKLGGTVSVLKGRAATQRDLGRLEEMACRNLTKLKDKCKASHLGKKSTLQ